jgi:hypothetical protein
MRWDELPRSDNIEDRRGDGGGRGFGLPIGGGGIGIGTVVVLGLIGWALGIDPSVLIGGAEIISGSSPTHYEQPLHEQPLREAPRRTGQPTDQTGQFVAAILGSADVQWAQLLAQQRVSYQRPRLVLFSNATSSACGDARSAMGPFYCPRDREIYLDTSFFDELRRRFRGCDGKACEFARAYIIAHEVGHHVQNLLGILPRVQAAQRTAGSKTAANRLQVRVELQADCFAGVWAYHAEQKWNLIEPGDIDAALQTAAAIGDDRLQRAAQGERPGAAIVPDAFTHGTSEQRKRWFTNGFKAGTIEACDTFNAAAQL